MLKKYILLLFISPLLLLSCATSKPKVGKTKAETLYLEAKELVEDDRFILATEKLNQIRGKFPYSYFATHAELMQADILFSQESYIESAAAYLIFKDFHPKHKEIPFVLFRTAESFYNQLPSTFDRDLSACGDAIRYYQDIIRLYPTTKYAKGSNKKIAKCRSMVLKRNLYIADFYFKTKVYDAARYRFLTILEKFQDKKTQEYSKQKIIEASLNLKEIDQCKKYYNLYFPSVSKSAQKNLSKFKNKCQ